ncbi:hypothetical protein NNJEOMEG_01403 [Fundidesulfovibrio magnetotacticus]|uniref:Solute-binding protein family 3/N-terminal domain-containing protein n=1 Tax=Fundidesulfovibrio magnetotacticus TaxID=2730080 RepID=A0A6V8LTY8_9BACT|nr:transporter substrate-binding domain-containing protein [Fundidesulfovibrio magnetotacticus]GFK93569.1 hypothetical protein NNJEOMEG_01403 [Fundidesulfovibrio magnetotacticus]
MALILRFQLLLLALLAFPGQTSAETLRIGATSAPPISQPDGNGRLDRILDEAFRRAGLEARFVTLPSERSLREADAGMLDGDNNRVAGLEATYSNLVRVSESNMNYEFMAFAASSNVRVESWADLERLSVGHIVGWKIVEENLRAASVTKVATAEELFRLLAGGRVDVVIYHRLGGEHYVNTLGLQGVRPLEPPLAVRPMYLYLNRRHEALAEPLAQALRAMKADGRHAALLAGERPAP